MSASATPDKSVTFAIPWFVFSDRDKVAKLDLCIEGLVRTDLLEGEAAHGKRESQRKGRESPTAVFVILTAYRKPSK